MDQHAVHHFINSDTLSSPPNSEIPSVILVLTELAEGLFCLNFHRLLISRGSLSSRPSCCVGGNKNRNIKSSKLNFIAGAVKVRESAILQAGQEIRSEIIRRCVVDDENIIRDCLLIIGMSGFLLGLLSFVKKLFRTITPILPLTPDHPPQFKQSRPSNGLWGTPTSYEITDVRVLQKVNRDETSGDLWRGTRLCSSITAITDYFL